LHHDFSLHQHYFTARLSIQILTQPVKTVNKEIAYFYKNIQMRIVLRGGRICLRKKTDYFIIKKKRNLIDPATRLALSGKPKMAGLKIILRQGKKYNAMDLDRQVY
jgi:hypothetical protein